MDDLISRQSAIDVIEKIFPADPMRNDYTQGITCGAALATEYIKQLPTAQPETHEERTETHACDCISRQAAINALTSHIMPHNNEDGTVTIGVLSKSSIKNILNKLPSAQPEQTNSWCINSWCVDCKEYDTENKCCPRYNRVIKQTLDDAYRHGETEAEARYHAQQRWIPCSERLPENGHYYLWCSDMGNVQSDYYWDGFENGMKYGYNIVAWMPLPEPYRAERRTDERSD